MKAKKFTLSAAALVCILAVAAAFVFNAATVEALSQVIRLGGATRIDTAVRISGEGWQQGSDNVIIANGYSYPDAMAGVPLAAQLDAPIILTKGEAPEESVAGELERLSAKNVYILGGELSISADFAAALTAKGYNVERIAGATRYATAAAVAGKMIELGAEPESVFIASGVNFPDALAVSPAAGVLGQPILYAGADGTLSTETLDVISDSDAAGAVILGGEVAVPAQVSEILTSVGVTGIERIAGSDRYQTSLAINRYYNDVLIGTDIAVASGENFPDALSGGAFAAQKSIPVVLMSNIRTIPGAYDYVTERNAGRTYVFGLEGALSSYAVNTFLAGGTITTTTTTTTTTAAPTTTTQKTTATTAAASSKKITPDGTVNVRSGAGLGCSKIGTINSGEVHAVIGSEKDSTGTVWYIISYKGGKGYVSSTVVRIVDGSNTNTNTSTGKKAYLTFDDGPSKNTTKILDILDQFNVKGTFFVIYRSGYESVYKDIVSRGHTIALHSYTHDYARIYRSTTAYFNDLNKLSDYVENLTGVRSKILRFPGGGSNTVSRSYCRGIMTTLTREVQNRGYKYYDWNVDSCDASANRVSASTIVSNIKRNCGSQKTAMILMHDAPSKTTTVTALPDIIRYLQSKGYEILPITESTPQVHHAVNN